MLLKVKPSHWLPNTLGSPMSVVTVPELAANTQHIYVSESTKSEDGAQVTVTLLI